MPANAEELVRKKNTRYQNNYFNSSFYSSKERTPTRQVKSRIFYLKVSDWILTYGSGSVYSGCHFEAQEPLNFPDVLD